MNITRFAWIPVVAFAALAWAIFRVGPAHPIDAPPSTPPPSANPERTMTVITEIRDERWMHPAGRVQFVALWADGSKWLGWAESVLKVADAADGRTLAQYEMPNAPIALCDDGSLLARDDGGWSLRNALDGRKFAGASDAELAAASRDGRFVVDWRPGRLRVWDRRAIEKPIRELALDDAVVRLDFGSDHRTVRFLSRDGTIGELDVTRGEPLRRKTGFPARPNPFGGGGLPVISPDGKWLACHAPIGLELLDASESFTEPQRRERTRTLEPPERVYGFRDFFFSPDSRLAAMTFHFKSSTPMGVHLWETQTGRFVATIRCPYPSQLAFSADGSLMTATALHSDGWGIWSTRDGARLTPDSFAADRIAVSPDGSLIATADNRGHTGIASVWEAATGRRVRTFHALVDNIEGLRFSPDGRFFVAIDAYRGGSVFSRGWYGEMAVWNVITGETVFKGDGVERGAGGPRPIEFSADGSLMATATPEGNIGVWTFPSCRLIREFKVDAYDGATTLLALRPDGRLVAWWREGKLTMCGLDGSRRVVPCAEPWRERNEEGDVYDHGPRMARIGFLPDGSALVVSHTSGVELRDPSTGELIGGFPLGYDEEPFLLVGPWVINDRLELFDPMTGKRVAAIGESYPFDSSAFDATPDGRFIAATRRTGMTVRRTERK